MTHLFVKDSQSRIVRYGIKCFRMDSGVKVQAFAYAKKSRNILTVANGYLDCFDNIGNCICGTYKILSTGGGKLAEVNCKKLD